MSKYAILFVKSGAKLRRTSFDTWMTFAAKLGAYLLCDKYVLLLTLAPLWGS